MSDPSITNAASDELGLELCNQASAIIRATGFTLAYASRSSEACYYRWGDRKALLRVAAHGQNGSPRNIPTDDPVTSRLTFGGNIRPKSEDGFERMVALAIGYYFLRSKDVPGA